MRVVTAPKKPFIPTRPPKENPAPFIYLSPIEETHGEKKDGRLTC